jgi:hypothetical protein
MAPSSMRTRPLTSSSPAWTSEPSPSCALRPKARRLAAARFEDTVLDAFDRVVEAVGGLPEGDMAVHEQAPDRRQRLAVWALLLAGLRATSGEPG